MADSSDPNWPIGYPCLPKRNLRRVQQVGWPNRFDLTPSDEAVVRPTRQATGGGPDTYDIQLLRHRNQPTVRVQRQDITIGTKRKYGDVLEVIGRPTPYDLTIQPSTYQSYRPFDRTMHLLAEEMWRKKETLSFLPFWFQSMTVDGVHHHIDTIISATHRSGMNTVLNDMNARWDGMKSQGTRVTANNMKSQIGLYFIDYWDFDRRQSDEEAMRYVGKSENISQRWTEHSRSIRDSNIYHYRTARAASQSKMYPWALFNDADDIAHSLALGEQLGVLLFETYNRHALRRKTTTDYDKEGHWFEDNAALAQMRGLAQAVFKQSGWRAPSDRSNYGMSGSGLNTTNPIVESIDSRYVKLCWTTLVVPGTMEICFQRPRKVRRDARGRHILFRIYGVGHLDNKGNPIFGANTADFQIAPNTAGAPPEGTDVWPVLERTLDGSPHPHHYGNLQGIGPFKNWADLRTLAVAVMWSDSHGQWKKTYLILQPDYSIQNLNAPGSTKSYLNTMSLFMYMTRTEWTDERPDDFKDLSIMRKATMTYHHLDQEVIHQIVSGSLLPPVSRPPRKDGSEVRAELRALPRIQNVDGPFGVVPPGTGNPRRTACDRCHFLRTRPGNTAGECRHVPGTRRCVPCEDMGLFCSWTSVDDLARARAEIDTALLPRGHHSGIVHVNIPDPKLGLLLGRS